MNPCELCKGACCESAVFPAIEKNTLIWLALRGRVTEDGVELENRCRYLKKGKCEPYDCRPQVCRDYPVGSVLCINTVKRRRARNAEKILNLINNFTLS